MYTAYHTASEEKTADELEALLQRRDSISRLQLYRKRLGMTQQELAVRSGVNLRTLQEYESGRKNIRQAAAEKLLSLSTALWCSPSDLINISQD
jgi:transcriptional regulator with XRE-family HTH domain